MSSNIVYAYGTETVTVPAGESIAVYSKGTCQVFNRVGYPNVPTQDDDLGTVSNGETVFGSYSSGATIILNAGAAGAMYQVGTAPRVVGITSVSVINGAPGTLNATGALTATLILGGLVTSSTAAAVAGTLPTGAVLDASSEFAVSDCFEWSIINTGPNTFTVTAASGHTVVGLMAVATATSRRFITRKTAADTFVTYNIS